MYIKGLGLIHEKNLKAKISWHCPFKAANPIKDQRRMVLYAIAFLFVQKDCTFVRLDIIAFFFWLSPFLLVFPVNFSYLKNLKLIGKASSFFWPNLDYILSQTV